MKLPVYEEAEEIQDVYEETIEEDKSWENIKDSIDDRKEQAKNEVDQANLQDQEKERVKEKLDGIDLAGNSLSDEPEMGVINQSLVADLETFTNSVPGGEQMFEYLMKKAESENFSLKLRVEDKEVTIEGNDFNPETTLTETEDRALRFFMGERKNE
jgi:hypothetical protein